MKNIYKRFKTLLFLGVLLTAGGSAFAQAEPHIDGDASTPATWGGNDAGDVPQMFGGTLADDVLIPSGFEITFSTVLFTQTQTLTIAAGAKLSGSTYIQVNNNSFNLVVDGTFITGDFQSKKGSVQINSPDGIMIVLGELDIDPNGPFVGDGKLFAISLASGSAQPGGSIEFQSNFNSWTGTIDNTWDNAANWTLTSYPQLSTDKAYIDPIPSNQPTISSAIAIETIIADEGSSLTIASNGSLTLSSGLLSEGTIDIQSDVSNTGNLIAGTTTGTGTVNVQRYIPSTNWHIVSSPVVEQQLGSFVTGQSILAHPTTPNTYALAPYEESSDNWNPYTLDSNTDNFTIAKGYVISRTSAGVVTFTGTSINTGDQSIAISNTNFGWNSVGNPYTSGINAKGSASFLETNSASLDPSYLGMYIWDQSLGTQGEYTVISIGGYSFPGPGGETELTQSLIALGQGFIIKAAAAAVGTVTFKPLMQTPDNSTLFKSAEKSAPAVRLTVKSGDLVNRTIVAFEKEKTIGLDPGYDVGKLKGNPDIALYSQLIEGSSDVDFAIQTLPDVSYESLSIPIGLDLANADMATFTLEMSDGFPYGAEVYLEDTEMGILTQLNIKDVEYSISLPNTKGYGRFNLVLKSYTGTETATNIAINKTDRPEFNVFAHNKLIFVNGPANENTRIAVYGIDGRIWYQNKADIATQNRIDANGFPTGIYLIKIDQSGVIQTHKIVLTDR